MASERNVMPKNDFSQFVDLQLPAQLLPMPCRSVVAFHLLKSFLSIYSSRLHTMKSYNACITKKKYEKKNVKFSTEAHRALFDGAHESTIWLNEMKKKYINQTIFNLTRRPNQINAVKRNLKIKMEKKSTR